MAAAMAGLAEAGYAVETLDNVVGGAHLRTGGRPDFALVWNGTKHKVATTADAFVRAGIPLYRVEHGFWDRRRNVQIDLDGFLAWASWANDWPEPPPEAEAKFAEYWQRPVLEVRARSEGYVLVLGQVARDSQLRESEFDGPAPLEKAVAKALPHGVEARFRPHPNATGVDASRVGNGRAQLPRIGGTLEDALAGARFMVSINSNSAVEATVAGVPCLEFGPSLALNAGVSRKAGLATLREDLRAMLDGYAPPHEAVRRYLLNLAMRQHSVADMRTGAFWEALTCRT